MRTHLSKIGPSDSNDHPNIFKKNSAIMRFIDFLTLEIVFLRHILDPVCQGNDEKEV